MKGYPSWFTPKLISIIMALLFLTGLLLAPTTLVLRMQLEFPWRLNSDYKVFTAALHAFFSLITIAVIGALSSIHMRQEWKREKNRLSGIILLSILFFLTLTGLGIYYFGNDSLSTISSVSHLAAGIVVFVIYVWHLSWSRLNK